jgi:hypothetical protein
LLNIGLLGKGSFGLKIKEKLENKFNLIWIADSNVDLKTLEKPHWVFIATPNIFHFEQAKFFLENGVNVFLEKPAVLNSEALKELIKLSEINESLLYISDIYRFKQELFKDKDNNSFAWSKSSSADQSSILDRFAYHHLSVIYNSFAIENPTYSISNISYESIKNLCFSLNIEGESFSFKYLIENNITSQNIVFGKVHANNNSHDDPLNDMIQYVLSGKEDFSINHKSALWVTKVIEEIKILLYPKINIIGAGIFGCVSAIELIKRGYNVDLFEKGNEILCETSSINQYRVHRGYHYPRSKETALQCKSSSKQFIKHFRQAILPSNGEYFYAISSEDSLISPNQYLTFLEEMQLEYEIVDNLPNTSLTIKAKEFIYDPYKLKEILKDRLHGSGVRTYLKKRVVPCEEDSKNFTVVSTYSRINEWLPSPELTQFELCEKPVLKLPKSYLNKSIVIMDGPFMCIDPLGDTGYHVMGNVVHAIHNSNIGYSPEIPEEFENQLNKGIVKNPKFSNISKFLQSAQPYFPDINQSDYIGSMFTIRAVKPYREHDDARPTIINSINPSLASVFSGKVCTCVAAAEEIADLAERFHT